MKRSDFERWKEEVRKIAVRICAATGAWHLREDLVSEGYLALVILSRNHGKIDPPLARKAVKSAMIDFLRSWFGKRGQKRTLYLEDMFRGRNGKSRWAEKIRNGKSPEETVLSKEIAENLRRVMETFSERERYVIEKIYFEGQTGKKVAEHLGITPGAVSQHKNRALRKLKEHLVEKVEKG